MKPEIVSMDGKTDADRATELRDEVRKHLLAVCKLCDQATAQGMRIEYGCGMDAFGRQVIARLDIVKSLL